MPIQHIIIRIRDQKIFHTISEAAETLGTPYNYLAKCIKEEKPCKGEYFEYFKGVGKNTTPEEYAERVRKKSEIAKQIEEAEAWEREFQKVLKFMKTRSEVMDISFDTYLEKFCNYYGKETI